MTDEIDIRPGVLANHGWSFSVAMGGRRFSIVVSQQVWHRLAQDGISPMELVRLGMELVRQQKIADSLPAHFDFEYLETRIHNFKKIIRREAQIEAAGSPR